MSWSYDATLLDPDTALGRTYIVRLTIGDTDTNDQLLADEEIDFYLSASGDSVRYAALRAVKALIAKFSRESDIWIGHTRVQRSQRARGFRELLAELEATTSMDMVIGMAVGGQSVAEKQELDSDTSAVQPGFRVGMDDIGSTT
jgi:hypothetical protein